MPSSLSIIILAHNRPELLRRALQSVFRHFNQDCEWELLLVLNGATDHVKNIASSFVHPRLKCLSLPGLLPGAARNYAVTQAKGDILFFLDDDVEIFCDPTEALFEIFARPNILAAGGPNLTPKNSAVLARASGQVMASFFGAAFMKARYSSRGPARLVGEESLILCNLAVRMSVFGGFPTQFLCGEENVFLLQLSPAKSFWWDPRLAVFHQRRSTWSALAKQAFVYGQGRARGIGMVPFWRAPLFFLPAGFLFYLPFAFYFPEPLYFYGAMTAFSAIKRFYESKDGIAALLQLALTPWVHIFYGLGFSFEFVGKGTPWLAKKYLFRSI